VQSKWRILDEKHTKLKKLKDFKNLNNRKEFKEITKIKDLNHSKNAVIPTNGLDFAFGCLC
jgi:hypothetical protein